MLFGLTLLPPVPLTLTPLSPHPSLGSSGEVISSAEVGVLASVGAHTVPVHRVPRVGVLSTGDELVDASEVGAPVGIVIASVTTTRAGRMQEGSVCV
jgi:molybdopterin biosynthesis enzyme